MINFAKNMTILNDFDKKYLFGGQDGGSTSGFSATGGEGMADTGGQGDGNNGSGGSNHGDPGGDGQV